MKILHVSDVFVRHGGGAPNVILELGKRQVQHGHTVTVATFQHHPDWPLEEEIDGIRVRRAPLRVGLLEKLWPFYLSGYRHMSRLGRELVKDFQPDIVHVHMPFSGAAVLVSVDPTTPVVYTFHGSWAEEYEVEASGLKRELGFYQLEQVLMRWFEKRALDRADKIVTLSEFMQERARRYGVEPRLDWEIIPAGVDHQKFKIQNSKFKIEFKQRHNIPENSFFAITVRRLARRMGLTELVQAVSLIKKEIPGFYLVIGGKGEMGPIINSQLSTLHLQNHIRLEGFIAEEELPDYLAAADLFVLPTQALEGFGLINLESMASGTPVVGTPVGAIPEVIGAFNSDLVTSGSEPHQIAEGMIRFYREYYVKKNDEIRQQAREYAEGFSWEKMMEKYEEVYGEVLNG